MDQASISKLQKTLAKGLRDVNVHYTNEHIVVNYIAYGKRSRKRYNDVKALEQAILAVANVTIDSAETLRIGGMDRKFEVKINLV